MENKLVIKIDWWLWRVIAMTGAITEIAKKRSVKVITSRPLAFWWNPYIESVHWLWDRRLYEDVIKGNDYFELEPYTDSKFFNDWVNWLDIAKDKLGLEEPAQPILFLAEHEKLDNTLDWFKPVLFQPFGSSMQMNWADKSYRSLRIDDAQYVANRLNDLGYTVYVVERNDQPKLKWCRQLTAENMRWLITLANRYPVFWIDSSMHHAAKAFNKPSLVIWAGTDAWRFGYPSHINLRNDEPYEYVPFRLWVDFNTDVINQHTNEFSRGFLNEAVEKFVEMSDKFYS